jgi:hypothetical protein
MTQYRDNYRCPFLRRGHDVSESVLGIMPLFVDQTQHSVRAPLMEHPGQKGDEK